MSSSQRVADPLLRLAMRTLPSAFRRDYADEILAFHYARLRDSRSRVNRLAIRLRATVDVLWHALVERKNLAGTLLRTRIAGRQVGRHSRHYAQITPQHFDELIMDMVREAKYAVRGLMKSRSFALAFVLTLGLGIGANTAIFSVVSGVLLRPLPHEGGDRVVYLRQDMAESAIPNVTFSVPEIQDYRDAATSLSGVAEFSALTFTMLANDEPRRVRSGIVSGNYFSVMGLETVAGRVFTAADDPESAAPVMLLSYDFWQRAFGGDQSVVGQTVRMNGRTIDIVGILEPVPDYPERIDVLVNTVASPHHMSAAMGHDREHRMTQVFARLAPGQTVETVNVELDGIARRLVAEYPETFIEGATPGVTVTPLKEALTRNARVMLLVLLGAAGFVLVIACANVANLTLTRAIKRERELTLRSVLGASRATLRRLLLVENLILSTTGAVVGLFLAESVIGLLIAYAERFTPRATEITVDGSVLTFTMVVAIGSALLLAFVPRLPKPSGLGSAANNTNSRSTSGVTARRLQRGLVIAQLSVSFVLLIGAGLFLRTLLNIQRVDPGFDLENVLTMEVPMSNSGGNATELKVFYDNVHGRVRSLPGVSHAALSSMVPLTSSPFLFEVEVEGFRTETGVRSPQANFRSTTPEYFRAVGSPILDGREFGEADRAGASSVVIINQAMADYYFPGQEVIGRRIRWTDPQFEFIGVARDWRTIVGVVADTRDFALDQAPIHSVFHPLEQEPWPAALVVRTTVDANSLGPTLVRLIRELNPNQPIENIVTLADLRDDATAPRRLNATMVGVFALLALVIAAVGVSGVLAFSVSSRISEFGIRLTLGANQQRLLTMIMREGGVLLVAGLAIGSVASLILSKTLSSLLFEVNNSDVATFVVAGTLLSAVGLTASFAPAWRASRVAPVEALRGE
jgi:predicted permease